MNQYYSSPPRSSTQDGPFFKEQLDIIMESVSKMSVASQKPEKRVYRVQEIERRLMMHRVAVKVLELALDQETQRELHRELPRLGDEGTEEGVLTPRTSTESGTEHGEVSSPPGGLFN